MMDAGGAGLVKQSRGPVHIYPAVGRAAGGVNHHLRPVYGFS
jgi:hypothetical protein